MWFNPSHRPRAVLEGKNLIAHADDRSRAESYLRSTTERLKRADEIIAGAYPTIEELHAGLPPLGGSLTRDIRATTTMWLAHLRNAAKPENNGVLELVEALDRMPSEPTIRQLWTFARRIIRDAGFHIVPWAPAVCMHRLRWYAALMEDERALAETVGGRMLRADVWQQIYLAGLEHWTGRTRPEEETVDFQTEILAQGALILEANFHSLGRWLPFVAGTEDPTPLAFPTEPPAEPEDDPEFAFVGSFDELKNALAPDDGHRVLGVVVGPRTREKKELAAAYEPLTRRLPLVRFGLQRMRGLVEEWPHAEEVIARLLGDLQVGQPIRLRPTLIVGGPGTGKTSLVQALCERLGLHYVLYSCASVADNSFGGTPSRWSTATASVPLEAIRASRQPNCVVLLDEVEKAGTSRHNGNLVSSVLPFLEEHTSSCYHETALDVAADLSRVSYLATANSLEIPAPLKDRFRILRMPDPGPEHIGALAKRIVGDLQRERGQEGMIPLLQHDELDVVRRAWRGGSLRQLRRAVEATVDLRERMEVRQ